MMKLQNKKRLKNVKPCRECGIMPDQLNYKADLSGDEEGIGYKIAIDNAKLAGRDYITYTEILCPNCKKNTHLFADNERAAQESWNAQQ